MKQCTALEAARRLEALQIHKVIGAGKNCLPKLIQIRQQPKKFQMTDADKEKTHRFAELISLSLNVPYEVESLLIISEIEVIADLFSCVKKSIKLLKELGETVIKCEECDNDFYNQLAVFCLNQT